VECFGNLSHGNVDRCQHLLDDSEGFWLRVFEDVFELSHLRGELVDEGVGEVLLLIHEEAVSAEAGRDKRD